jgi:hypothetical protein
VVSQRVAVKAGFAPAGQSFLMCPEPARHTRISATSCQRHSAFRTSAPTDRRR